MKCNNHPEDHSSSAGICSSCLRQRLLALIAAQGNHFKQDDEFSHENLPPPLFIRSVSRRKSDFIDTFHSLPDQKFFSTPQIGIAGEIIVDDHTRIKKKRSSKFWFPNLFRSKSEIIITDSDRTVSESIETSTANVPARRSWFSSVLSRKKKHRTYSLDESTIGCHRSTHRNRGRGMSPAMCFDDEEDARHCHVETSLCNTEELKQTPRRTPGRNGGGGRRRHLSRNVSEIVFCLSPLVRPSPNRIWNQKSGLPPEIGGAGEARVPVKPCSSVATSSFCKNRSRKLVDFGRRKH